MCVYKTLELHYTLIQCFQTVPHNDSHFLIDCLIRLYNWRPEAIPVVWEWYGLFTGSRLFRSSLVSASDWLPTDCLLYTVHSYHSLASYNLIGRAPPTTVCTHFCVLIFIKPSGKRFTVTHKCKAHSQSQNTLVVVCLVFVVRLWDLLLFL